MKLNVIQKCCKIQYISEEFTSTPVTVVTRRMVLTGCVLGSFPYEDSKA